jgi:site-specific recombinase XerD
MPDQKVNFHLKTVSVDCNSPFPLTFHVARHSFCTRIAMQTGSVFEVMRYAGILKIDTAMIYVNLAKMFADGR